MLWGIFHIKGEQGSLVLDMGAGRKACQNEENRRETYGDISI